VLCNCLKVGLDFVSTDFQAVAWHFGRRKRMAYQTADRQLQSRSRDNKLRFTYAIQSIRRRGLTYTK